MHLPNTKPVTVVLIAAALSACGQHEPQRAQDATPAPVEQAAGASAMRIEKVTLASGLVIEDLQAGSGEMCLPDSWVRVHYTCRLPDDTQVDGSGASPVVYHLPRMIRGWQDGMPGMRVGGRRRLTVPSQLGYGSRDIKDARGNTVIPADSLLTYEIVLLDIVPPPDAVEPPSPPEATSHGG